MGYQLDHAGAAAPLTEARARVEAFALDEARFGGYAAQRRWCVEVEGVYRGAAALLGADVDDVVFASSASGGWRQLVGALPWRCGDRVVITSHEYVSFVMGWERLARRHGLELDVVEAGADGLVCPEALREALKRPARLVALVHVPTLSGVVQPIEALSRVVREASDAWVLVDAAQSVGQLPVSVEALGADALVTTGRKYLCGPRGTGLLVVRPRLRRVLDVPLPDVQALRWPAATTDALRLDARVLESWERPVGALLGLGAAIEVARERASGEVGERIRRWCLDARDRLGALPCVRLMPAPTAGAQVCALALEHPQLTPQALRDRLAHQGIFTAALEPILAPRCPHVAGTSGVLRVSPHADTSEEALDALCEAVAQALIA